MRDELHFSRWLQQSRSPHQRWVVIERVYDAKPRCTACSTAPQLRQELCGPCWLKDWKRGERSALDYPLDAPLPAGVEVSGRFPAPL
jgi:hypothetical protein